MRWFAAMLVCGVAAWCIWSYLIPRRDQLFPPEKHLAPEGTFFLLQRVSRQTDSGVYALPPGAEVHRISQEGSTLTVSDGGKTFEVDAWQLTNDLDVAAALIRNDHENKKRFQSAIEQQNRELSEKKQQMYIESARRMEEHEQARKAAAAAGRPNPLDRGAYNQQQTVVGKVLYVDEHGQRYWADTLGNRHYVP
jgi:hypothetical protein